MKKAKAKKPKKQKKHKNIGKNTPVKMGYFCFSSVGGCEKNKSVLIVSLLLNLMRGKA